MMPATSRSRERQIVMPFVLDGDRRPLSILNVAFPFAAVGFDAVGGAEQVLSHLDAGLVAAGHRSFIVARQGSRTAGELLAVAAPRGPIDDRVRKRMYALYRRAIPQALGSWPIDLVHMHGIDFHAYLPPAGVPVLVTAHLPLAFWYPAVALCRRILAARPLRVSRSQQA